jgi:hypothetical protein
MLSISPGSAIRGPLIFFATINVLMFFQVQANKTETALNLQF